MGVTQIDINKNRIEAFDIAKGIGILLMVMGHTGFGMDFSKIIHTFHMPLFFFISGYFYRPQKNNNFKSYLIHQLNVLIVPYLVFAVFYEILHYIYVGDWSLQYFLKSLVSSNHNRIDVAGALWFLLSLFSCKIIYCILQHRIKGLLPLTITISVISFLAMTLRKFSIMLPLCVDSALSMLIIVHAGYLLYAYRDKRLLHRLSTLSPGIFILVVILFIACGFLNDDVNIRRNRYGTEVLYLISCIGGIVLTMNIAHMLSKPANKVLTFLRESLSFWGRESVVFLLTNELFIFIVSEFFVVVGVSQSLVSSNLWFRAIILLGAMALMSLLALLSRKSPFTYIFGKKALFKPIDK